MKRRARKRKLYLGVLLAFVLTVMPVESLISTQALAAESGTVYTCVVNPCYRHPVTGVIEDSGGESSYTTGQGMVEGTIYSTGILEVTDSGNYYATIRMSLMDYTSDHSFWVQTVGDSGWSSPALGITATGTDSNGTTNDICVQVPSENCVIRISMYVEPMGRTVIFYIYLSDFTSGNSTDMTATMVSTSSSSTSSTTSSSSSSTTSSSSSLSSSSLTGSSTTSDEETEATEETTEEETAEETTETTELVSTITEAATSDTTTDDTLDSAEGLSLSTAGETVEEDEEGSALSASSLSGTVWELILLRTLPPVIIGLTYLIATAIVISIFKRNWRRWGDDYDEDDEDYDEDDEDD